MLTRVKLTQQIIENSWLKLAGIRNPEEVAVYAANDVLFPTRGQPLATTFAIFVVFQG